MFADVALYHAQTRRSLVLALALALQQAMYELLFRAAGMKFFPLTAMRRFGARAQFLPDE